MFIKLEVEYMLPKFSLGRKPLLLLTLRHRRVTREQLGEREYINILSSVDSSFCLPNDFNFNIDLYIV